jgi:hypothetical protein
MEHSTLILSSLLFRVYSTHRFSMEHDTTIYIYIFIPLPGMAMDYNSHLNNNELRYSWVIYTT